MKAFLKSIPGRLCIAGVATLLLAAMGLCGYTGWYYMQPKFQDVTIELGQPFPELSAFFTHKTIPEKVSMVTDAGQLPLNQTGRYPLSFLHGKKPQTVVLTVQDTTGPELTVQPVEIDLEESVTIESFIKTASDPSGAVTLEFLDQPDNNRLGNQEIRIQAEDTHGNKTVCVTTLTVHEDTVPPVFSGMTDMLVEKYSTPDYEAGVMVTDAKDGEVGFTYDAGKVDISRPGIYYVNYIAEDSKGNQATYRRKVEVKQDPTDTEKLVNQVAAQLSDSPEEIRDFVRDGIGYSSSWGGDDPVWYGLRNRKGNCYVHAIVLDALLRAKGYPTQLIWCFDKSHYWNLVCIDNVWYHIDATPSDHTHNRYSLMNDQQRYETLEGRNWDRELWPECP